MCLDGVCVSGWWCVCLDGGVCVCVCVCAGVKINTRASARGE